MPRLVQIFIILAAHVFCVNAISGGYEGNARVPAEASNLVRREVREDTASFEEQGQKVLTELSSKVEAELASFAAITAADPFASLHVGLKDNQVDNLNLATACIYMLMGSMVFCTLFFSLLGAGDAHVSLASWKIMDGAIALGSTAMIFQFWRNLMFVTGGGHHVTHGAAIGFAIARWLISMMVVPIIIGQFKTGGVRMEAAWQLGGYFMGFSGMDALGISLNRWPFNSNPFVFLAGNIVFMVGMSLWMTWCSIWRQRCFGTKDGWTEEYMEVKHRCEDAENNAFGIMNGLSMTMFIRFVVSGKLPDLADTPRMHTNPELLGMWIALLVMLPVSVVASMSKKPAGPTVDRIRSCALAFLEMMCAWQIFYCIQWSFWWKLHITGIVGGSEIDEVCAMMGVTILAYLCVFATIFVAGKVASIAHKDAEAIFHELLSPLSLLVGFSWAMTMFITVKGVGAGYKDRVRGTAKELQLILIILAFLFPFWTMVVMPVTLQKEKAMEPAAEK